MALLERSDWYDLARTTNWTPKYVTEEELFPPVMSDKFGVPLAKWESYDEPYKVSYRDYVNVQRQKDVDAYSVKAGLKRSDFYQKADPRWMTLLKFHYGAIALAEYVASQSEAHMTRFGKAPGMRNMSTFGNLDEIRHAQLQLFFPHEHVSKDRQFDWVHKAFHTNEWGVVAARHFFDNTIRARDAVEIAIMLTFAFETGFTNLQFLALASDAARAGDYTFSNLISSIQTDEARHAQIGAPALKVLIANGKKEEAQRSVDIAFWRNYRLLLVLTGLSMDYYTPLEHREKSFKEFMEEWIVAQFERTMLDLGLDKPWYWDQFLEDLSVCHHGEHLGIWYWRPTVWWNPAAGVTPAEREWLEKKYPGWNATWGKCWDVIIDNLLNGRKELTYPETLPIICNMCNIPIVGTPHTPHPYKDHFLDYEGRRYHFCTEMCRWVFEVEPERYKGHLSVVDRFLAGQIQPMDLGGALKYMGLSPGEIGDDAGNYAWVEEYRRPKAAAE